MKILALWVHKGEKTGEYIIRYADGPFVPIERIVSVCIPPSSSPDAVLAIIEKEYTKRGISLDYTL